ncbi:DUF4440 domain-containing protein [Robertkochia flava]|uniref:DUF4440 domain-containing protein n=1 Tax=Robertkochia flava TaxID=3447986 RepID=UPI001CCF2326|nr:DUF4440 domain-containing protein [Robertkochia marina]
MRVTLVLIALLLLGCKPEENQARPDSIAEAAPTVTARDTLAIFNIVNIQTMGTPEERKSIWAEDGRWLQAFGRVFHGRDTINNFIKKLHADPGYRVSKRINAGAPEIRFLRPDVAVVHQYHEREGQKINDKVTPVRKINTTYIMTRENGTWLLRDKVTMDERQ